MVYAEKPVTPVEELKSNIQKGVKGGKEAPIRYLKELFPIHDWAWRYNFEWFFGDFIAGVTVGLVAIPASVSYATKLVGVPAQFGLYTSFIGALMYSLFATSKDVTMGITAVLSLVVGQTIQQYVPNGSTEDKVTYAITLAFWTGLFMLLLGLFRLGIVIDFIPVREYTFKYTPTSFIHNPY
ncbi:Sulfate permease 2 [Rhizoclosmatium sp. JEL0117]|nr:Sulfate permease 2 [Rhizoclosmatium sp. JEL0117]